MNISREAVLAVLWEELRRDPAGPASDRVLLKRLICKIENILEASGMDSALRRAQEANWREPAAANASEVAFPSPVAASGVIYEAPQLPFCEAIHTANNKHCVCTASVKVPNPAKHGFYVSLCPLCAEAHLDWTSHGRCFVTR